MEELIKFLIEYERRLSETIDKLQEYIFELREELKAIKKSGS